MKKEMIIYYVVYRRNRKILVDAFSDIGGVNLNEFPSVKSLKWSISHDRSIYKRYKVTYQRIYKSEWNN